MIEEPRALLLLIGIIPIVIISYVRYKKSIKGVIAVAGGTEGQTANLYMIRSFFSALSFILAIVFIILALSGMQWGRTIPRERPRETETVLVFDISRSMLAGDVRPTRLGLSTAVARNLIDGNPGHAFGIVIFKGDGLVFLPVTSDHASLAAYLDALDPNLITSPGTNIEAGLSTAVTAFPQVREVRKAVILFTDGDGLDGDARTGAVELGEADIDLAIVAAGSPNPVPIVIDGEAVTDVDGNTALTAARIDVLESVREAAGGVLVSLDDGDVVERLDEFIGGEGRLDRGSYKNQYRLFLGWSLTFIILWGALRTVRWRGVF